MREDKSYKSNHKGENEDFVALCLYIWNFILMSFEFDFGFSAVP